MVKHMHTRASLFGRDDHLPLKNETETEVLDRPTRESLFLLFFFFKSYICQKELSKNQFAHLSVTKLIDKSCP